MILCIVVNIFHKVETGLLRVRLLFKRSESHIKEPRKKVEIRLKQYEDQLMEQITILEQVLEIEDLSEPTREVGKELYDLAKDFLDSKYIQNSRKRINSMLVTLLDYDDFSIWVNDQTKNHAAKINCFINSIREE